VIICNIIVIPNKKPRFQKELEMKMKETIAPEAIMVRNINVSLVLLTGTSRLGLRSMTS